MRALAIAAPTWLAIVYSSSISPTVNRRRRLLMAWITPITWSPDCKGTQTSDVTPSPSIGQERFRWSAATSCTAVGVSNSSTHPAMPSPRRGFMVSTISRERLRLALMSRRPAAGSYRNRANLSTCSRFSTLSATNSITRLRLRVAPTAWDSSYRAAASCARRVASSYSQAFSKATAAWEATADSRDTSASE